MRALPLACSLLLLAAPTAGAGELNLRWSACFGDGGVTNRAFACDTNSGVEQLIGSFLMPHDLAQVTGNEIVVDIGFAGTSIPAWWDFKNTGACRQTSLTFNAVAPPSAAACVEWAGGSVVSLLVSYANVSFLPPNSARIRAVTVVAPEAVANLVGGQEYFAFTLVINHQKTVGTGSCAGCSLGACLDLRALNVTTSDPRNDLQLRPGGGGLAFFDALATWQGGAGVISPNGNCPAATPTRHSTWGGVKTLYR